MFEQCIHMIAASPPFPSKCSSGFLSPRVDSSSVPRPCQPPATAPDRDRSVNPVCAQLICDSSDQCCQWFQPCVPCVSQPATSCDPSVLQSVSCSSNPMHSCQHPVFFYHHVLPALQSVTCFSAPMRFTLSFSHWDLLECKYLGCNNYCIANF